MLKERYDNLDGLRALSCLGIIAMHIKANTDYQIAGWFYKTFISSWTLFVYLFLLISGFGMFCGYYEKFRSGKADINNFYTKRYQKILPFFASLIILDIMLERDVSNLIEGLTEMTLVFGLLPNNELQVIGVGWTLGVIFLFYMLFPFFVWLCWTKKRAFFSFLVSVLLNIFCEIYFFTEKFVVSTFSPRHSFLYCAPFFIAGGLIYLYRQEIKKMVSSHRRLSLAACIGLTVLFFMYYSNIDINHPGPLMLAVFIPWLCYAISVESRLLDNKVAHYLSGISLECYLAHMVIFRVAEKAHCLYVFGDGWIGYILVCVLVMMGLLAFIEVWKRMWRLIEKIYVRVMK